VRLRLAPLLLAALAGPAAAAAAPPFTVTLRAPTHTPAATAAWPISVTAKDARGRPVPAVLHMQILLAGFKVGDVDGGRRYRFTGTWREAKGEEITWPAAARGQRLTFEAVVTAHAVTRKVDFWIEVR